MDNLEGKNKFLEKPKLESLNKLKTSKETELVIKNTSNSEGFTGEFWQTFKWELIPIIDKFSPPPKGDNTSMGPAVLWYQN